MESNPADGMRSPGQDKKLPHFLSEEELNRLLEKPPTGKPLGVRDRAILETLYSAGVRVSELTGLNVEDVDLDSGLAVVRGKGKGERVGPVGRPALGAPKPWLCARGAGGEKKNSEPSAVVLEKEWSARSSSARAMVVGKN